MHTLGSQRPLSEVVRSGATDQDPYVVLPRVRRVLVKKTAGSPTFIQFDAVRTYDDDAVILIKDLKGDAGANNIIMKFSDGEFADGLTSLVISTNYGWIAVAPDPDGGAWYITSV